MYLEEGLLAHLTAKARAFYNRLTGINSKIINHQSKIKPIHWGVNVFGFLNSESGVGEAGRTLIRALGQANIPLALLNSPHAPHRRLEKQFVKLFTRKNPYAINIIAIYGDMFAKEIDYFGEKRFKDRYNIAYWTWELERLPESWIPLLGRINEVWTPSSFAAAAIRQANQKIPITVVPHAIEIKKYRYSRADYGLPDDAFLFLFMFDFYSAFERKNPLAVIRAFKNAFPKNERVGLIIKCSNSHIDPENFHKLEKKLSRLNLDILKLFLTTWNGTRWAA